MSLPVTIFLPSKLLAALRWQRHRSVNQPHAIRFSTERKRFASAKRRFDSANPGQSRPCRRCGSEMTAAFGNGAFRADPLRALIRFASRAGLAGTPAEMFVSNVERRGGNLWSR